VSANPPLAAGAPRRARIGRSLHRRFVAGVTLAAALFALVAGGLAYRLGAQRAEHAARATVASLEAAVAKTAAIGVYAHDAVLTHEVVDGITRNPLVLRAEIVDAQGHALPQAAGGKPAAAERAAAAEVALELSSPFDAGEKIGALRVDVDPDELGSIARREAWTFAALMAAQSLLVALVVAIAGARLVSRPIVRLARTLESMPPGSAGRLTVPAGHAADEIGILVRSANDLLAANAQALQRERELRMDIEAMEAQYRQIFDSTSAGIFVLDREGRLINGNPTVLRLVGREMSDMRQLRGQDFLGRVFVRPERVRALIEESARRGETMSADLELLAASGESRWAHCLVSVQDGGTHPAVDDVVAGGGIIEGVLYDITERKRAERDVRRRAERDALTGALNRAATEEAIDRFIAQGSADASMSLLYLDLDGFKAINDRLGHGCGDRVLQQITARIRTELRRASDVVGRIGGDEFLILLPNDGAGDSAAPQVAAAVLARASQPIELDDGVVVQVGVSIGLAIFPRHGATRRELVHAADEAMYAVKRHGKNAVASALPFAWDMEDGQQGSGLRA
jgi:diguanylate cyclase (GGDEF)-like protein/PAS domain S-box-containing protein